MAKVKRYRALYADPAWFHNDQLPGAKRGARKHYTCMPTNEIARMPLPLMHDDSWLFLWRLGTHVEDYLFVCKAWGFVPSGEIVWVKTTKDRKRLKMGMGRTSRNCHEVCIIAKRGRPKLNDRSIRSVIFSPLGEHSAKPLEMYSLIERFCDGPYYEMFARHRQPGWGQEGNQLP